MEEFEKILTVVKRCCTHGDAVVDEMMTPKGVRVHASDLKNICIALRQDPSVFFDMLSCITVIDNGPAAGTFEIVYNLYSIPFDQHFALKVSVARDGAEVDSLESVWKTANWHEREAFDMFGIRFTGHPDLRRILLPADWEGHPLKKDYKQQEYYRGVSLD